MRTINRATLLMIGIGFATVPANAQEATERYIPIGQSPGLSGMYTVVGEITRVDEQRGLITITTQDGDQTALVTENTRIWVDRSGERQSNITGSYADCEVGRTVEVSYVDPEEKREVDWVKVASGR